MGCSQRPVIGFWPDPRVVLSLHFKVGSPCLPVASALSMGASVKMVKAKVGVWAKRLPLS